MRCPESRQARSRASRGLSSQKPVGDDPKRPRALLAAMSRRRFAEVRDLRPRRRRRRPPTHLAALLAMVVVTGAACLAPDAGSDVEGKTVQPSTTVTLPTEARTSPSSSAPSSTTEALGASGGSTDAFTTSGVVRELIPVLTRIGTGLRGIGVEVAFEPEFLTLLTGGDSPSDEDRPTAIFVVSESVHVGELPPAPPSVVLLMPDGGDVEPESTTILVEDLHHRSTRMVFPVPEAIDVLGGGVTSPASIRVGLVEDGSISDGNTFVWNLPLHLPDSVLRQLSTTGGP